MIISHINPAVHIIINKFYVWAMQQWILTDCFPILRSNPIFSAWWRIYFCLPETSILVNNCQLGLWKAGDQHYSSDPSMELSTRFSRYLCPGSTKPLSVCWSWRWVSLSYYHLQGVCLADINDSVVPMLTFKGQWGVCGSPQPLLNFWGSH